jgi:hypothetical protein
MGPQHFGKLDPGYGIRFIEKSRIRIRNQDKRRIWFRIKVKSWDLLRLNMEP